MLPQWIPAIRPFLSIELIEVLEAGLGTGWSTTCQSESGFYLLACHVCNSNEI